MTAFDKHRPQDAPETVLAADGKTTLHRFRVDGVIFAPSRASALARVDAAGLYLDAARLYDEDARLQGLDAERDSHDGSPAPDFRVRPPGWPEDDLLGQSVCAEHVPDYATGRQTPSDAPCVVCGEPSVIVLPKIIPDEP
jgi:hypothetical protein